MNAKKIVETVPIKTVPKKIVETVNAVNALSSEERKAVLKELTRRDTPLSLNFFGVNVDRWKEAADAAGGSLTEWIEEALNEKVKRMGK